MAIDAYMGYYLIVLVEQEGCTKCFTNIVFNLLIKAPSYCCESELTCVQRSRKLIIRSLGSLAGLSLRWSVLVGPDQHSRKPTSSEERKTKSDQQKKRKKKKRFFFKAKSLLTGT